MLVHEEKLSNHTSKISPKIVKTINFGKKIKYPKCYILSSLFNFRLSRNIMDSFYKNLTCNCEINEKMVYYYGINSIDSHCKTFSGYIKEN